LIGAALPLAGCATYRQEEVVQVDPGQSLLHSAEEALAAGRPDDAARLFAQLPDPLRGEVCEREALAWLAAGQPARAAEALDKGTAPLSSNQHVLRALIAWRSDDANTAVAQIGQAIAADPENAAAWALKGEFNLTLGQNDEAATALAKAQSLLADPQPLKQVVSYNLSTASFIIGDFTGAYENYRVYVDLKGGMDADDQRVLGMMAYAMRDHHRAVNHWRELDADSREAIVALVADESDAYQALVP
jgi:tetratricopeptide (TPR) repeat protein